MNWFTIEPVSADTFAISEYSHWEETHAYLLCGADSALLIDTGLGVSNIRHVTDHLTSLPITVATTHAHWDHIGGHALFEQIAVHALEAEWLSGQFPIPLQVVKQNLMREPCPFPPEFEIDRYQIFRGTPQRIFQDGAQFDLRNRRLTAIHTPGHSPGHCCLFEEDRGWLYTGDLIYDGCLDAFYPTTDPQAFFQSVKKIQALHAGKLLPGHHRLEIPPGRVDEVAQGFASLSERGLLRQGSGRFDFGAFQIHL